MQADEQTSLEDISKMLTDRRIRLQLTDPFINGIMELRIIIDERCIFYLYKATDPNKAVPIFNGKVVDPDEQVDMTHVSGVWKLAKDSPERLS
jgi:hypothetical protein